MTSMASHSTTVFKLRVGISRGSFWVVTCYRNLCPIKNQFFFVLPKSGTYSLITVHCIIYHPNALHQLFHCILRSTNYNKPALFTPQKSGWILEYQFLSVRHEPWTSFLQEPAARSPPAYLTSTATLGIQQGQNYVFYINSTGNIHFTNYRISRFLRTVIPIYVTSQIHFRRRLIRNLALVQDHFPSSYRW